MPTQAKEGAARDPVCNMRVLPPSLLCHAAILQLMTYLLRPTIAYKALELGADAALLGVIAASFALVPLLVAVMVGRAVDSGNENAILLLGAFMMVLAGAGLVFWSGSLTLLIVWNVVLGLGHLLSVLGEQNLVARTSRGSLDSAFGIYTFVGSAGQAAGPLLITLFGGRETIPNTLFLFGVYSAAASVMLFITIGITLRGIRGAGSRREMRKIPQSKIMASPPEVRRQMFGAMAVSMTVIGAIDLISIYLPALGVERGIPAGVIGLLLTIRAIATMFSRLGLAWLVSKFGRQQLITVSTAIAAAAIIGLSLPIDVWAMGAVLILAGVSLGIGQPLTMALITLAAPPGTQGTWLAIRLAANRLSQTVLPAAVGLVAGSASTSGVFGAMSAALATTAAMTWRSRRG
jgi:MFS family permease